MNGRARNHGLAGWSSARQRRARVPSWACNMCPHRQHHVPGTHSRVHWWVAGGPRSCSRHVRNRRCQRRRLHQAAVSQPPEKTDGRDAVRRPAPSGSASARPRQLYVNAGLAIISVCGHEANQRSPMSAIGIRIKFLFDVDLGDRSGELHRATAGTRQTALTRAWTVLGQDTP